MKPIIKGLHHDHIDGSAAMAGIILELYKAAGKPFPFASAAAWLAYFQNPHEDIGKRFGTVTSVLQSAEALRLAGYTYGLHRANEGYAYVEAKFAPQYHTAGGLTLAQAADAMCEGLWRAASVSGMRIVPQLSIVRESSPDDGLAVANVAVTYDGRVVLDVACTEAGHPPIKHLSAFKRTWGTATKTDCHASEWVERLPDDTAESYRERMHRNLRQAVYDCQANGVGHAITLIDDPELMAFMAFNGIRVAGCPLSNLVCGGIKDVRELGIDKLLDAGIIYTLNADDDLFLPPMSEVIAACDAAYDFTPEQTRQLAENVWLGAFCTDP